MKSIDNYDIKPCLKDKYLSLLEEMEILSDELKDILKSIHQLQRNGNFRLFWNQEYSQKKCDDELVSLLLKHISEIEDGQNEMTVKWEALIKCHKTKNPLIYPDYLKDKNIENIQRLLNASQSKDRQIELHFNNCLINKEYVDKFLYLFNELPKYNKNKKQDDSYAKKIATQWAYPKTKQWWDKYNQVLNMPEIIEQHTWASIINLINEVLNIITDERKQFNEIYQDEVMSAVSEQVIPYIIKSDLVLKSCKKHITKIKRFYDSEIEKEKIIINALNAPWDAVHSLRDITELPKPVLSPTDYELILNWPNPYELSTYKSKALISAREAEVAALNLYISLYGDAKDISILQLKSPHDDRWIYADIEANGRWIDVKNARTSFSSASSYSEHCVPKFKLDRTKNDVIISSFLSSYGDDRKLIRWLGETTWSEIRILQMEFDSQYLQVSFSTELQNSFLPAWLFDYPSACYEDREKNIALISSSEFVFPRQECDIGTALLANKLIPENVKGPLDVEAGKIERRIKRCGLKRAILYMHILDRFCHCTINGNAFRSIGIDKILFSKFNNNIPLAVYDPLETVWKLWSVLVSVSENCSQEVKRFTVYRLRGPNILQGKISNDRWSTIIAYCGGKRRLSNGTMVKCGQNPIYLGKDERCSSCCRLICHCCGFCSIQCSMCKPRQDKWEA